LYRGIDYFKKGYQPKTNIVKNQKGFLFSESHRVLASSRDHFSLLLNVHGVKEVRQIEIHTAEPQPCAFELEQAVEKLKSCRSPVIDQVPSESIKAGG